MDEKEVKVWISYLLIIADGQHYVPGSDPGLLPSLGDVPSELQHLGSEIFQNSSQVDRSGPLVGLAVGQRVVAWLVEC